jgi:pilus assembly protein CpaB
MISTRSIMAGVAISAIAIAAYTLGKGSAPPPSAAPANQQVIVREKPADPMVEILVAGKALPAGSRVGAEDLKWVAWPEAHRPPTSVLRRDRPTAREDFQGVLVRANVTVGETVTPDRFILDRSRSFMSAVLTEGMRAVAIPASPVDTAGGFILPGDRVDILRVVTSAGGAKAEPILTNVKILAIGNQIKEEDGQRTMTGATATIEVLPAQADLIAVAQKSGSLTMTLRPFTKDAGEHPVQAAPLEKKEEAKSLRIVRSGVASELPR